MVFVAHDRDLRGSIFIELGNLRLILRCNEIPGSARRQQNVWPLLPRGLLLNTLADDATSRSSVILSNRPAARSVSAIASTPFTLVPESLRSLLRLMSAETST